LGGPTFLWPVTLAVERLQTMSDATGVVVGIDGGATYSFGVAVDLSGTARAAAKAGSLNFFGTSLQEARRSLTQLMRTLEVSLPLGNELVYTVIGSAALFSEAAPREKELLCRGIIPMEATRLVSDVMTAYHAASLGRPGVLIVGGTGSSFLARNEDGHYAQVGAWGHLLGDEGSAYWIGRECIRAAIAASEGTGPATCLLEVILQWFDVKILTDIVPIIYQPKYAKHRFAALAGFAADHADPSDPVWMAICERAGLELARQAIAAVRLVNLHVRPVPVWLNGSVVRLNSAVRESLFRNMSAHLPIQHEPMRLAPLLGAAALALSAAGVAVDAEMVERLAASYAAINTEPPSQSAAPHHGSRGDLRRADNVQGSAA
jgi:N-acetylglucosamine kinase-like BadF-type ATPase